MREQRIPYHLSGGTSFFERTEIKDLMCYLRLAVNPDDNAAFLRIVNTPRRDIGVASRGNYRPVCRHAAHQPVRSGAVAGMSCAAEAAQRARACAEFCNRIIETGDRGERADPVAAVRDLFEHIGYEAWIREQSDNAVVAERRIENTRELVAWLAPPPGRQPGAGFDRPDRALVPADQP